MKKIRLGDVLRVKRGMSLPGENYAIEGQYKRLTLGNFNYPGGGFKENNSKADIYYVGEVREEFILKEGDIITPLTEQVPGLLGSTAFIPTSDLYIQSGDVGLVLPDETKIDKSYVFYLLSSQIIKKQLASSAQQTKIRHTSPDKIMECIAWIPDLSSQRRIGSLLRSIDLAIDANKRINDNLEAQAKLLFDEWFVKDGGSKTEDAKDEVLGNVVSVVKKTFNPEKEPEIQLEHYSIPAFDAGKFPVFESSLSIKSNKYIVDSDCFMISKLNPTTKRVWRPYCLTNHAVCSTEFIVFKAKEREYTDFLYSLVNCDAFSEHLCNHVTGSTGSRQRTNPDDALKFVFKLPTEAVIAEFSSIAAPIYEQIRTNAIENNSLKQLRDYLLPLLMSGQISIGD